MKVRGHILEVALLLFLFCQTSARGNVYATDIHINGSLNAGVIVPGASATISYILNEPASAVTLRVFSGTNVIHAISVSGGGAGAQVGSNSVVWGGTNDGGAAVPPGIYTVSITAASRGYDEWTQISDNTNFSAEGLTGIAVNRNTNSAYYGRVFVSCSYPVFTILKCNADGSPGDEGGSSNGGLPWGAGQGIYGFYSPWKLAVGPNDMVYIDDFSGNGVVYAFDETISTNYLVALDETNYPAPYPQLSGLCITGSATNAEIWMTDYNPIEFDVNTNPSAGIVRWQLGPDGTVATNDTGTVIAPVTNSSPMSWAPYDVSVDTNGFVYTIQQVPRDPPSGIVPIICFPPYEGFPETNALWTTGTGDTNLTYDSGIAVDPLGTFVAVAVLGADSQGGNSGLLNLYYVTNGQFFANIDQTGGDMYIDVAWDNVGNLYATDYDYYLWRAYSPPGSNQATTVAVPFFQAYNALKPPALLNPVVSGSGLNFTLQGQSNVTYIIEESLDLMNWDPVCTNYSADSDRPISLSCDDNQDFYRAVAVP